MGFQPTQWLPVRIALVLGIVAPLTVKAAPEIRSGGIVNAASFQTAFVPGSGIAQGSIATAFGSGLGPQTGVSASTFPLATTLAGVSVRLTTSGRTIDAYPIFVVQDQINFLVPSSTPVGQAEIRITFNGETSQAATAGIVAGAFGIFTFNDGYSTRGVVQNFVSASDVPLNQPQSSARRAQTVIAYGTGLGAISSPDNVAAPAGDLAASRLEVLVGGVPAKVLYAGRSSCCAGLDQVVFELPESSPLGCTVPLTMRLGTSYSNVANISISSDGRPCAEDPAAGANVSCFSGAGGTFGVVEVVFQLPERDLYTHSAQGLFARSSGCASFPPITLGTCTIGTEFSGAGSGSSPQTPRAPAPVTPPVTTTLLDAGPLINLKTPAGNVQFTRTTGPAYIEQGPSRTTATMTAGSYVLSGPGGRDVPAFSETFDFAPLRLVSPARDSQLNLNAPATLTWSGGQYARDYVTLYLYLIDVLQTPGSPLTETLQTTVVCTTRGGASGRYTFPQWIWSQVPSAHGRSALLSSGVVGISGGSFFEPMKFNVSGLDYGLTLNLYTGQSYYIKSTR